MGVISPAFPRKDGADPALVSLTPMQRNPLFKTAPGRAPGYSGSSRDLQPLHHSQVDKPPKGVLEHLAAALLSAFWFCFCSHLYCAKLQCPFQRDLPAPCAGTPVSLTHMFLTHMFLAHASLHMQPAAARQGWCGTPQLQC